MSDSKKILLGVTGGIAAYKACLLTRLLTAQGHQVQVVMTESAKHFVGAATFQALTGRAVRDSLWDAQAEAAMGHIELARWADAIVIAPATAKTLARLRAGMADDLLTTLCLATDRPVLIAPAMNRLMWAAAATQDNMSVLRSRGVRVVGPDSGDQACGEVGAGRMSEPEAIVSALNALFSVTAPTAKPSGELIGKHVLITAGPTVEDIDPVRFISNRSSGRMGYALAEAAVAMGAEVTLVSGPVTLASPQDCRRVDVRSAQQMHDAVMDGLKTKNMPVDVFIGVAAVADYTPTEVHAQKRKKSDGEVWSLDLARTPDIVTEVAKHQPRPYVVGFAAETERVAEYAQAKRTRKGMDMIAANHVGQHLAFGQTDNTLDVFWEGGHQNIPRADKSLVARQLLSLIAEQLSP